MNSFTINSANLFYNLLQLQIKQFGTTQMNSIIIDELTPTTFKQISPIQYFTNVLSKQNNHIDYQSQPHIRLNFIKTTPKEKNIQPIIITREGLVEDNIQTNKHDVIIGRKTNQHFSFEQKPEIELADMGLSSQHCIIKTEGTFQNFFSLKEDIVSFLGKYQNLPFRCLRIINDFLKLTPSLQILDMKSAAGTFLKLNKKNSIGQNDGYLFGTDASMKVVSIQNIGSQSNQSETYLFNCLQKDIQKGIEIHGLSHEEWFRFNKFLQQQKTLLPKEKKNKKKYQLILSNRAFLRAEFQIQGIVQKKLFLEKIDEVQSVYKVGRNLDADISIQMNTISRKQSQILYDRSLQIWQIFDGDQSKQSANGTWVSIQKNFKLKRNQQEPKEIYDQQIIKISDTQFNVEFINFQNKKKIKLNYELQSRILQGEDRL